MEYNSIYEVRKAWCAELGIDASEAQNIYEVSLLLLDYYSGGTPVPPTPPTPSYQGLCFTALEDNSSVSMTHQNGNEPDIKISLDGTNWEEWDGTEVILNNGDKAYFKGTSLNFNTTKLSYFSMTGKIAASGNIMSLVDDGMCTATTIPSNYYFNRLFQDCSSLTTAPELPATTLAQGCYLQMFKNCTSLTEAPELQATTLANSCYGTMYLGCTSLTTVPELPAITLADSCYYGMFEYCTSLTTAPELPASALTTQCYYYMFCGCSSLTEAPVLPATAVLARSYALMFSGCTSLNKVTVYLNDISISSGTKNWLNNVASIGDLYNLGGATFVSGADGIPDGWTEHNSLNT